MKTKKQENMSKGKLGRKQNIKRFKKQEKYVQVSTAPNIKKQTKYK